MPELPRDIEIQRVMNLVQGFGWEKVKEELIGTEMHLTVKKKLLTEEEASMPGVPS